MFFPFILFEINKDFTQLLLNKILPQKINEKTFIFCEWNFLHAQIWSNFASMFATKNKWKFPSFAKLAQTSFIARVGKFRNQCLSGLNFTRAVFDLSHNKLKLKKVQIIFLKKVISEEKLFLNKVIFEEKLFFTKIRDHFSY